MYRSIYIYEYIFFFYLYKERTSKGAKREPNVARGSQREPKGNPKTIKWELKVYRNAAPSRSIHGIRKRSPTSQQDDLQNISFREQCFITQCCKN